MARTNGSRRICGSWSIRRSQKIAAPAEAPEMDAMKLGYVELANEPRYANKLRPFRDRLHGSRASLSGKSDGIGRCPEVSFRIRLRPARRWIRTDGQSSS